jgi:hypothetical protein
LFFHHGAYVLGNGELVRMPLPLTPINQP